MKVAFRSATVLTLKFPSVKNYDLYKYYYIRWHGTSAENLSEPHSRGTFGEIFSATFPVLIEFLHILYPGILERFNSLNL
jgi:hypothetical protein